MKLLLFCILFAMVVTPTVQNQIMTWLLRLVESTLPVNDPPLTITHEQVAEFVPKIDSEPGESSETDKQPDNAGECIGEESLVTEGGGVADRGMFPWQVSVFQDVHWLCGGSLISQQWILTAGHCAYKRTIFMVMLGVFDWAALELDRTYRISTSKTVHPDYNPTSLVNDIALIRLTPPVIFSTIIGVIRLPKVSQASITFEGEPTLTCGWGKLMETTTKMATQLNYAIMETVHIELCASVYGTASITSSTICAMGKSTNSTKVCSDDGGAPLMIKEPDGRFTLIGVGSFSPSTGCTKPYPSGYARVTSYLGWISSSTNIAIEA